MPPWVEWYEVLYYEHITTRQLSGGVDVGDGGLRTVKINAGGHGSGLGLGHGGDATLARDSKRAAHPQPEAARVCHVAAMSHVRTLPRSS